MIANRKLCLFARNFDKHDSSCVFPPRGVVIGVVGVGVVRDHGIQEELKSRGNHVRGRLGQGLDVYSTEFSTKRNKV
jgi:hypothetical protein